MVIMVSATTATASATTATASATTARMNDYILYRKHLTTDTVDLLSQVTMLEAFVSSTSE